MDLLSSVLHEIRDGHAPAAVASRRAFAFAMDRSRMRARNLNVANPDIHFTGENSRKNNAYSDTIGHPKFLKPQVAMP